MSGVDEMDDTVSDEAELPLVLVAPPVVLRFIPADDEVSISSRQRTRSLASWTSSSCISRRTLAIPATQLKPATAHDRVVVVVDLYSASHSASNALNVPLRRKKMSFQSRLEAVGTQSRVPE